MDFGAGSADAAKTISAWIGSISTFVLLPLLKTWWEKRKNAATVAAMASQPMSPQMHLPGSAGNPFGPAPATDPMLVARLDRLELTVRENELRQARWTIDELKKALDEITRDQAGTAAALSAERRYKDELVLQLECERQKRATAERVVFERDARITDLEAELSKLEAKTPTDRPPR